MCGFGMSDCVYHFTETISKDWLKTPGFHHYIFSENQSDAIKEKSTDDIHEEQDNVKSQKIGGELSKGPKAPLVKHGCIVMDILM